MSDTPETTEVLEHVNIQITDVVRARFEKKYRKNVEGCWIWTAYKDSDGYGQFKYDGKAWRAHRFSYEMYVGPIPPDMDLDHTCHIRRCVNPAHLEVVTHEENMKRLRKPPDTFEDEDDPENWDVTTPNVVLLWADQVAKRSKLERAIVAQGRGFEVVAAKDAPWRDCAVESGYIPQDPMSWITLFLDCVALGVNWKVACGKILGVSPFTVTRWRNLNSDFKNDMIEAIAEGRRTRFTELEDRTVDMLERKMSAAPFKEVVRLLEVMRRREEMEKYPRRDRGDGNGGGGNSGPTYNLIIQTQPGKEIETLEKAAEVMSGAYRVVDDAPALPPPDEDE